VSAEPFHQFNMSNRARKLLPSKATATAASAAAVTATSAAAVVAQAAQMSQIAVG